MLLIVVCLKSLIIFLFHAPLPIFNRLVNGAKTYNLLRAVFYSRRIAERLLLMRFNPLSRLRSSDKTPRLLISFAAHLYMLVVEPVGLPLT